MSERRTLTIGVAINLGNYESLRLEVSDCVQTEGEAAELAAYLNRVLDGYGQNDAATRASIDKYRARVLEKHEAETPAAPAADPLDELFGPVPVSEGMEKKEEAVISEPAPAVPVTGSVLPEADPAPVVPVTGSVLPEADPAPVVPVTGSVLPEADPAPVVPVTGSVLPEADPAPAVPVTGSALPEADPAPVVPVTGSEPVPVTVAEVSPEKTMEAPVTYTCEKCGASVSKVQRDVSNLFMGKTLCKACMK